MPSPRNPTPSCQDYRTDVADPEQFDVDPDPTLYVDADPDLDPDPDPNIT